MSKIKARIVMGTVLLALSILSMPATNALESQYQPLAPTQSTDQLNAKSCDQSRTVFNESRPRITIYNNTDEEWHGFSFYYYFKVDHGRTPRLDVEDSNGTDVEIEHIKHDLWRIRFACRDCTIGAEEIFPNPDGVDVKLSYTDGSGWYKNDDPSYIAQECHGEEGWNDLPFNDSIPVFDNNYHRVGGNEVFDWPNDKVANIVEHDLFAPLPESFQFDLATPVGDWEAEEMVPDTLDLSRMAADTISGMTQVVDYEEPYDPDLQFQLFFQTDWNHNPPVLNHESQSDDGLGKFLGPMVLSR